MARQKGIIKLKGTIAGLTFVDSKAYGAHTRAARGSNKEVMVNEVLQANADNARRVTSAASPVLKQLKAIEGGFSGGDLWPRMTGRMFRTKSMRMEVLLESIKGVELNERYAFTRLFVKVPKVNVGFKKKELTIEVEMHSHAHFSRDVKASEYLYEVTVLFLDGKGGSVKDVMETEWISFDEALDIYVMAFTIPKGMKYFLIVAGVRGGRGGKEIERFGARGYYIVDWGKCIEGLGGRKSEVGGLRSEV
jgi:hypothetical protein